MKSFKINTTQFEKIGKGLQQFTSDTAKNISSGIDAAGKTLKPKIDEAQTVLNKAAQNIQNSPVGQASQAVGQTVGKAASDTQNFLHDTFVLPGAQKKEITKLQKEFQRDQGEMSLEAENLYKIRLQTVEIIQVGENLINTIARKPKEFDKLLEEVRIQTEDFDYHKKIAQEQVEMVKSTVSKASLGVGAAAAAAAVAPSAAMGIAMAFGTASTGTAISALSGAAATNAALAWLGGGALAAGGGGMAAGSTLLATLAGPLGWAIAGTSIIAAGMSYTYKNAKGNDERQKIIEDILAKTQDVKMQTVQIRSLTAKTDMLKNQVGTLITSLQPLQGSDFMDLSEANRYSLMSLVNDLHSLSVTINEVIKS